MIKILKTLTALAILSVSAGQAAAEIEVNLYLGSQSSPHSRITGDVNGTPYSELIGWQGKSFSMPPYYGARATWWKSETLGFGLEFTHAKAYAPASDLSVSGLLSSMEFTDGHNIITANIHRRWAGQWLNGRATPYVMGGLGIALPHVDIQPAYGGAPHTFGYQLTGPAARIGAGLTYALNDSWNVFGEYQFTWSQNKVTLNGGGTLNGKIITNALNFGVGYSF